MNGHCAQAIRCGHRPAPFYPRGAGKVFTRRTMPDFSSLDPPQAAPFAAADASATAPERTSRRPAPAAAMP